MQRFLVRMAWEDTGEYSTVVLAETEEQAQRVCKLEMAMIRTENEEVDEAINCAAYWQRRHGDEWELVECSPFSRWLQ